MLIDKSNFKKFEVNILKKGNSIQWNKCPNSILSS